MEIQYVPVGEVSLNPGNPRMITDEAFKRLVNSLRDSPELFDARPLLCSNRTGKLLILGGNMRYRAALELKYREVPIIVLEGLDEEQERAIVIKDNGSFGAWDFDLLANEWSDLPLAAWGVEVPPGWEDVVSVGEEPGSRYNQKISGLEYKPTQEEAPPLESLYDRKRYDELLIAIGQAGVPEDVKLFLMLAAGRHVVFDYQQIAEYYAHAPREVQELMEASALVVIDYERAVADGYVQLSQRLVGLVDPNASEEEEDEEEDD